MNNKNKKETNGCAADLCKHRWHYVRYVYIDEWDSLMSVRKFPRGNYAKFICESCGRVKFIREIFNEDNKVC